MRLLKTKPHLSDGEIKSIMKSQTDHRAFLDWQIIYSVQRNPGKTAEEIGAILGVSKYKVYKVIQRYNKYGKQWREKYQWGGRREARSIMSLEEESALLKEVESEALSGQILTYKDIKEKVEEKVQRKVSDDYIWDLFKRHGWKKKSPRPRHPKSNKQEQAAFKKNSKKTWQPNH